MIYQFSLHTAGLAVGICLLVISLACLFRPALFRNLARQLPRSRAAGVVLFSLAFVWSLWLLATMEMGEFASFSPTAPDRSAGWVSSRAALSG